MSSQQITLIAVIVIVLVILVVWLARRLRKKPGVEITGEDSQDANKQLYIGNLSYQVSEQDLKEHFLKYGNIVQVRIVRNYSSGRSKGFGFVTYSRVEEANKALAAHGEKYQGRTIVVRIAKPR